jgi:hypothetical protein
LRAVQNGEETVPSAHPAARSGCWWCLVRTGLKARREGEKISAGKRTKPASANEEVATEERACLGATNCSGGARMDRLLSLCC